MTNPMTAAKTWLRNKCIHVPDDWLQACIEWITEENQGISQVQSQINELVYEQWLLSDLHELRSQCLPAEITSASKFQLTGTYALQIDSLVDVSQSYYSQLQKVKGTANDNVNVTAEPPAPWEPKATRMLMLKLTDGSVDVQGMEYQRITNLHNQIHPGTKILVQGSVMCRHGVLMLAGENVKVLNGEVDTLMEVNTETNVLQKALENSMQDSGKQYRQDFDGGMVQNKKPGNRVNVRSETSYNSAVKREPFSQTNRSIAAGQRGQTPNYQGRQVGNKVETVNNDDEWDDDIALDDLLDDMDDFEMGQIPPPPPSLNMKTSSVPTKPQNKEKLQLTNKNAQRSIAQYGLNIGSTSSGNSTSSNYTTTVKTEICSSRKDTNKSNTSNLSAFTTLAKSCALPKGHHSTNRKTSDSSYANSASNMSELMNRGDRRVTSTSITVEGEKLFEDDDGYELDDFDFASVLSSDTGVSKNTGMPPGSEKLADKSVNTQICTDGVKQNVPSVGTVLTKSAKTCFVKEKQTAVSKMSVNNDIPIEIEANIHQMNSTNSSNLDSDTGIEISVDYEDDCPELTYIPQKSKPLFAPPSRTLDSYSQGSNQCIDQDIQRAGLKRTFSDGDHRRALTSMPDIGIQSEPFTYLSVVQKHLPTHEIFTCKVKAYISTLTGKLEHNGGKKWSLACKINDGTATQDVDLSNAVLTKLIGFSAPDSMEMRKRARVDKNIRDTLVKGVQQCQQKLIELLCVMEIQVMPGCTKPEIISLCDFTRFDIQNLEARVSSAISK